MEKEILYEAIEQMKGIDDYLDSLKTHNIDLFETPLFSAAGILFDILIKSHYTDEGVDWISWWCFECNYGRNPLEAYDSEGNLICQSFDNLYEYCKQYECLKKS